MKYGLPCSRIVATEVGDLLGDPRWIVRCAGCRLEDLVDEKATSWCELWTAGDLEKERRAELPEQ